MSHPRSGSSSLSSSSYPGRLWLRRPYRLALLFALAGAFCGAVGALVWMWLSQQHELIAVPLIAVITGGLIGALLLFLHQLGVELYLATSRERARRALQQTVETVAERERMELAEVPTSPAPHRTLGTLFLLTERVEEALKHLQTAAKLDDRNAEVYNNAGVLMAQQGRLERAMRCFQRAARLAPDDPTIHLNLGHLLTLRQEMKAALEEAHQAVELAADSPVTHNRLGVLLRLQGETEAAREHFQRAVELDPTSGDLWNNLGTALQACGEKEAAIQALQRAIQVEPGHARAHANLGLVYYLGGQYAEAEEELRRAREMEPESVICRNNLGMVLYARGDVEAALAEFQAAMEQSEEAVEPRHNLGLVYLEQGRPERALPILENASRRFPHARSLRQTLGCVYFATHEFTLAQQEFQRILDMHPQDPVAHHNWAVAALALNDVAGAAQALDRALELAPHHPEILFHRGYTEHLQGQAAQAVRFYVRAFNPPPPWPELYYNLALCYYAMGQKEACFRNLEQALEVDPNLGWVHYPRGCVLHAREGKTTPEALAAWETALQFEPQNIDLRLTLAIGYYRQHQSDRALEELRRVFHRTQQVQVLHYIGLAQAQKGDLDSAIASFKQVVEHQPQDPVVRSNLGLACYLAGRADEAVEQWALVAQISPGYASRREAVQYSEYDDSEMLMPPLDWAGRALRRRPLTPGFQHRFLLGYEDETWQVVVSDPDLAQVPPLQRALRRLEEALHEVQV